MTPPGKYHLLGSVEGESSHSTESPVVVTSIRSTSVRPLTTLFRVHLVLNIRVYGCPCPVPLFFHETSEVILQEWTTVVRGRTFHTPDPPVPRVLDSEHSHLYLSTGNFEPGVKGSELPCTCPRVRSPRRRCDYNTRVDRRKEKFPK